MSRYFRFLLLTVVLAGGDHLFASAAGSFSGGLPARDTSSDYTVRIDGLAKGAEGREIVWLADADVFSSSSMELDRARIDDSGRFTLKTALVSGVMPTYIQIDYYSTGLFVEAGREYRLQMADFDYHTDERINAFIVSDQLPELRYVLLDRQQKPDTTDLNFWLGKYSFLYNRMMIRDFERINVRKDTLPVVRFMRLSDSLFAAVPDSFFQAYRAYTEAGLREFSGLASRRELFREYIENRPIDPNNPAQVSFLKTFYLHYFASNRYLPFSQVMRIVNRNDFSPQTRLAVMLDSLGLDYSLRNEVLREWVLIRATEEVMDNERLNAGNIRAMLDVLRQQTKFPGHATAIGNLLKKKDELDQRRYFTGIRLRDTSGRAVSVDSLLEPGLFHYFVFVRSDYSHCPSCGEESDRLAKVWNGLSIDVKSAVRVIYINCDYTFAMYYHDAMKNRYPWQYLHFNGNIEWIRTIDAARFPAYILVDDKGYVLNSEFNAPSQNIEDVFRRMATLKSLQDRRKSGL